MTDHKRIVRFRELIVQDYGDETNLIIVHEGETAFLPFLLNRFQMGRNIGRIGGFNRGEQRIKLCRSSPQRDSGSESSVS